MEKKPDLLKPNLSTIKSNSPPEDRFVTGSFCLVLFFVCLFQCSISARNMEKSFFTHNNCCRGRRFSVTLPSEFSKHTHPYQVSVSLNPGIICLHAHIGVPLSNPPPSSSALCWSDPTRPETSHLTLEAVLKFLTFINEPCNPGT